MKIRIGVVGLGYWGPNYVRNFVRHPDSEVIWGCDLSDKSLNGISQLYPQLKVTNNYQDLLKDDSIACIVIATPPATHYEIANAALKANKHVTVAKPLAINLHQAQQLLDLAKEKKLLIYGDLTYLHTGAVKAIKNLIHKGNLGKPLYYDSVRSNLGLIQKDINVIWDLVPHDLSIIDFCFGLKPQKVFATASKHHEYYQTEEMAHIVINYSNNFIAHIHVSWLSPVKIRTILIGGSKRMIYFNDIEPDEKVKIYDKGVDILSEEITPFKPIYRSGKVTIPKIDNEEALFLEIKDIVNQISNKKIYYQNADVNIRIIKLLEACDKSIKTGKPITINNF